MPYGKTLHYPGCGCPPNWRSACRLADSVDSEVLAAFAEVLSEKVLPARTLTVVYMLPHHNVTGGMKCLVEHIRLLKTRGHRYRSPVAIAILPSPRLPALASSPRPHGPHPCCCRHRPNSIGWWAESADMALTLAVLYRLIAVHRSDKASRAMPPWTEVEADIDIVCSLNQRLDDVYDVRDIDVVVVGIFHQVQYRRPRDSLTAPTFLPRLSCLHGFAFQSVNSPLYTEETSPHSLSFFSSIRVLDALLSSPSIHSWVSRFLDPLVCLLIFLAWLGACGMMHLSRCGVTDQ